MNELVQIMDTYYSGMANDYSEVIKMSGLTFLVLILGFILWRIMSGVAGKRKRPAKSNYFGNPYNEQWQKKIK